MTDMVARWVPVAFRLSRPRPADSNTRDGLARFGN